MISEVIRQDLVSITSEFWEELRKLAGKTVLITGANGMIPAYIADTIAEFNKFVSPPCQLVLYSRNPTTPNSRLGHLLDNPNVTHVACDVGKPFQVIGVPDLIIHGASRASPISFKKQPIDTIDANVNGTRTLLDYARENKTGFVLMSSSEVYGNPPAEVIPTPETYLGNVDVLGDMACYAEAKRFSETLCSSFLREHQVPVKIARIFHTFGPGLRNDGKTLANMFATGIKTGKIALRDPGSSRRAYSYVSDTARGIFSLIFRGEPGQAYNIGNDENSVSVYEMAKLVRKVLGLESEVEVPANYGGGERIQDRAPNLGKLRALGYSPKVGVEEGLRRLRDYYKEVGID